VPYALDEIVPWGRSFDEYRRMFALTEHDLAGRIFGCGDGPASFNAELTATGGAVVSGDPLYRLDAEQIGECIDRTFETVMRQTEDNVDEFVWGPVIADLGSLRTARRDAMALFLDDFARVGRRGRYIGCELPRLPFRRGAFDLAVCSHLLFLYSAQLSADFHVEAIVELCGVAAQVRVFPVLELGSRRSRHLDVVVERVTAAGLDVDIVDVDYEFQRGGNQMLKVAARCVS
jgi:hypothetical protein